MASVSTILLSFLKAGDHIIVPECAYGMCPNFNLFLCYFILSQLFLSFSSLDITIRIKIIIRRYTRAGERSAARLRGGGIYLSPFRDSKTYYIDTWFETAPLLSSSN